MTRSLTQELGSFLQLWQVVESCLAVVNAESNLDALSGLITFLRSQAPTGVLLSSVLFLSPKFGRFVTMVITGWMSSHYTSLLSCLQQLAADSSGKDGHFRKNGDNENHSDTSGLQRSVVEVNVLRLFLS